MEAYSKDLLRGIGGAGADDGEEKVQRLESRTEEVDLSLGLSLGGRFGTDRRSGEGLAGSSSAALAPPAPAMTNSPPRSGLPLSSIKEEPVAGLPSQGSPDGQGTPSTQGRSLSSAVVSWSEATNRVMASASALIAAALGSGGGRQDASARPVAMMREMPLVWTNGLPNGMRTIGFLYEYNRVDEVRVLCVCHGSFFTPAGFVEHAGGGQVANPLRSILVKRPSWL